MISGKNSMAKYLHSQQELQRQLRQITRRHRYWLVFGLVCLMLTAYVSVHHSTYLIPYGLKQEAELSMTVASPYYLTTLAQDDAATYFNVTPQTIDNASAIFLTRLNPGLYGKLQQAMQARAAAYRRDNQSTVFFAMDGARVKGESVTLKGNLLTLIGDRVTQHQVIHLQVTYHSVNGLRYIERWDYEDQ